MANKVDLYDPTLQEKVPHTLEVDNNGEVVATSDQSGHVQKFPAGMTKEEFAEEARQREENVQDQEVISPEELERREEAMAKSQELVDSFQTIEDNPEE